MAVRRGLRHGRCIAGGNADPITDRNDYPYVNLGPPFLQQPGQAWNALTVGGFTNLDSLTAEDVTIGYPQPLAVAGQLSPHSRSASGGNRPVKPDIVMEAGNTAPGGGLENPDAQGLSILTIRSTASGGASLVRRTCQTSLRRLLRRMPSRRSPLRCRTRARAPGVPFWCTRHGGL